MSSGFPPSVRRRHAGRWIAVVVASVLLHLVALDLLPHWTLDPVFEEAASNEPLRATLMPAIRADEAPSGEASRTVEPAARTRPSKRSEPPAEFVPQTEDVIPQVTVGTTVPEAAPATQGPQATDDRDAVVVAVAPAVSAPDDAAPLSPPPAAVAPQSARLEYRVASNDPRNADPTGYYGAGSIDWWIADGRYRSDLNAGLEILFVKVSLLSSHSEGTITAAGLAPDRYTEKTRRRAMVATNFNRDARRSISFSSSQASVPLVAGVQDRLSLLFQVGALLLGDAGRSNAAGRIEMPVAGVRGEVENWVFDNQGIVTIETGAGPVSTTHLRRTPRPGSNDRAIDVWIAHDNGGYPARVLYTEQNGTTVEMTLQKISALE